MDEFSQESVGAGDINYPGSLNRVKNCHHGTITDIFSIWLHELLTKSTAGYHTSRYGHCGMLDLLSMHDDNVLLSVWIEDIVDHTRLILIRSASGLIQMMCRGLQ